MGEVNARIPVSCMSSTVAVDAADNAGSSWARARSNAPAANSPCAVSNVPRACVRGSSNWSAACWDSMADFQARSNGAPMSRNHACVPAACGFANLLMTKDADGVIVLDPHAVGCRIELDETRRSADRDQLGRR